MVKEKTKFKIEWYCKKCKIEYYSEDKGCWKCKQPKYSILVSDYLRSKK